MTWQECLMNAQQPTKQIFFSFALLIWQATGLPLTLCSPPAPLCSFCLLVCLHASLSHLDIVPAKEHGAPPPTPEFAFKLQNLHLRFCPRRLPAVGPIRGNDKRPAWVHSKAWPSRPWCSRPRTRMGHWRCPITTPPSRWRPFRLSLGIQVFRPLRVFLRPRRAPSQKSTVGRGAPVSRRPRRMLQMSLKHSVFILESLFLWKKNPPKWALLLKCSFLAQQFCAILERSCRRALCAIVQHIMTQKSPSKQNECNCVTEETQTNCDETGDVRATCLSCRKLCISQLAPPASHQTAPRRHY